MQKVIDEKPYVLLGPVFSGSVMVTMGWRKQAEIPRSSAARRPHHADRATPSVPHVVRPAVAMPKIANYIRDELKAKKVAVV